MRLGLVVRNALMAERAVVGCLQALLSGRSVVDSVNDMVGSCVATENDAFHPVERMAARRHQLRDRILNRVRLGDFATVREIMLVASIPRQTANRWLREAGIDLAVARLRRIARMHGQEELYLAARSGMRKPTAAQQRRDNMRSVRRFNAANGRPAEPGSA
jgi:hypothetical protein